MPWADWFNCRDVTRHGLSSDARSSQISSENIHVSSTGAPKFLIAGAQHLE